MKKISTIVCALLLLASCQKDVMKPDVISVIYDGNGGTLNGESTMKQIMSSQGGVIKSFDFYNGYNGFICWNTDRNGNGDTYYPGDTLTLKVCEYSTMNLYAQWGARVITNNVTEITENTAKSGGEIINHTDATVIQKGVCWSTTHNPTVHSFITKDGQGNDSYTSSITKLNANTTYYVRAYATTNDYTSYGNEVCFSTLQATTTPTVTTDAASSITHETATCGGNVTSDGGAAVTARGVCWSTSNNPTIGDNHTIDGIGTGSFTSNIEGLAGKTTYCVRAYATNNKGTSYGPQIKFTTLETPPIPTVTTESVSNITSTTATCGGNVTSDGGVAVTARGVCWSTTQNPTINESHTTDGNGMGSFTSNMTGLADNTTYYVRAYATNANGTKYGEQNSFMTNGIADGHEYVDLGLPSGTLWATCNVGAKNPEDYGKYYAWGEVKTKIDYSWSTYKWGNGSLCELTKYNSNPYYGIVDNKVTLDPEDDAAYMNWGNSWRTPTGSELFELVWGGNCTWLWTTQGGNIGYRVTGSNGNSIFLPAAGSKWETSTYNIGVYGNYWSNGTSDYESLGALELEFDLNGNGMNGFFRAEGLSVRPVLNQ